LKRYDKGERKGGARKGKRKGRRCFKSSTPTMDKRRWKIGNDASGHSRGRNRDRHRKRKKIEGK